MSGSEKDAALRWIFDPRHTRYLNFENREDWVVKAVTRWIPAIRDFTLPTDPEITQHWRADNPPLSQATLYEALSRIKALALVRERSTCSYGHSHLGLIEYGGEIILFSVPRWQSVSVETREILTAVWTIKEAMVIYYPQSRGWANACPSEAAHLQVENYSTIWLIKVERFLATFVPADQAYWESLEIPHQLRKLRTQTFPPCLPPAVLKMCQKCPS